MKKINILMESLLEKKCQFLYRKLRDTEQLNKEILDRLNKVQEEKDSLQKDVEVIRERTKREKTREN